MFSRHFLRAVALGSALLLSCSHAIAGRGRDHRPAGVVYTATNAVDGNRVLAYARGFGGELWLADSFPTGGLGTGAGLGNQSGLVLTRDGRWLLAVNAGSGEVSLFEVTEEVLVLRDVVPSGGDLPLSIAVDHNLVYVLNGGGTSTTPDNITGFVLSRDDGRLTALPGSTRALSGDSVDPAQVGFSPSGDVLVVTEKGTDRVTTFVVGDDGLASGANPQASVGATPFGFAFDRSGRLFVSEAFGGATDASAMSSYAVDGNGVLAMISGSVPTHQTAACWVALDRTGRFAYTTNTGSGSISGYRVRYNGAISLLDASGVTASTGAGSSPIDVAVSKDGKFLYALSGGSNTITGYRIRWDGSLDPVETEGGLPSGTNGLAVQ